MFSLAILCILKSSSSLPMNLNCDTYEPKFPQGYRNCSHTQAESSCADNARFTWTNFVSATCFCDDLCHVYGDCCEDTTHSEISKVKVHVQLSIEVFECVPLKSVLPYKDVSILLVNKCPRLSDVSDTHTVESCEYKNKTDVFLNWPVSDTDGILYKNVYCGLCNDKLVTDLAYWTSNIQCRRSTGPDNVQTEKEFYELLRSKLADGKCTISYSPPPGGRSFRACKTNINLCPSTWTDKCSSTLCQSGETSYVFSASDYRAYKNKYCAFCNGVNETICQDVLSEIHATGLMLGSSPPFFPLSIVLDLNKGSGSVIEGGAGVGHIRYEGEMLHCVPGQVYDPIRNHCRTVTCRNGFRLINGTCRADDGDKVDCLTVVLDKEEFVFLDEQRVYENLTGAILESGSYEQLPNGSLLTCTNFTRNYTQTDLVQLKFSRAQTIVSVVGQTISIFGLGLHFSVYMIFPPLRNLAGKNLMCLVFSLFWAQLLFLVGIGRTENYGSCVFIAALIHYMFLASFSWMHVMSYDIWKAFTSGTKPMSAKDSKVAFKRYAAYGWGAPGIVLLISLLVNFLADESCSIRPAYGEFICWLGYRNGLFIFFALPISFVIANNLFFYTMTIISIQRISKATKMVVNKNSEQMRLGLYIKLSVIMGLTWIFGFIATGTGSEVLWYLFLITGTLQGAFICVSFVFTKNVYQLVEERFHRRLVDVSKSDVTKSTTVSN